MPGQPNKQPLRTLTCSTPGSGPEDMGDLGDGTSLVGWQYLRRLQDLLQTLHQHKAHPNRKLFYGVLSARMHNEYFKK